MNRRTIVEWDTENNEEESGELLSTKISLENDDDGNIYIYFDMGRGIQFKRLINPVEIVKLSRFFYDASDFIKGFS